IQSDRLDKYAVWKTGMEKYLSGLTGGKYGNIKLEENLPRGICVGGETILGIEFLSAGMKDVYALAVRLSMAEIFLGEDKKGFIMMDDPLVEMDPDRQAMAANILREFSQKKQLIILTCHPSSAELLGGE